MMTWWYLGFRLVVFLSVSGLVVYAALAVARIMARGALTRTEILATAIVLATGQVTVTQILLGLFGLLTWWPVMALNGLLASGLFLVARRRCLECPPRPDAGGEHPHDPVMWCIVLGVGVIMLVNLRKVLGVPPFGTDSLGYHLPIAVEWLQTGKTLIGNDIPFTFYPGVSELVDLWLLLPFRDSVLVNLQNWPFALLTGLALYNLARRAGASIRWAAYGGLLFISIRAVQVVLAFVDFQDNDVLIAAFFLAAINLGIAAVYSDNRTLLVGEGIALGLLAGAKYGGLGYAALAGAVHIFLAVTQRKTRRLLRDITTIALVSFLIGGFWYVRNWIKVGNPLTPMTVQLAGHVIFPGRASIFEGVLYHSSILAKIAEPGAFRLFVDRALLEQGGMAVALSVPVLILITLRWGYRFLFLKRRSPLEAALYVLLPWGAFGLFMTTPLAAENVKGTLNQLQFGYSPIRYGLPFWALGCFLLAGLLFDERWRQSWVPDVCTVLILTHSFVTMLPHQSEFSAPALSRFDLVAWLVLPACAAVVERLRHTTPRRRWH